MADKFGITLEEENRRLKDAITELLAKNDRQAAYIQKLIDSVNEHAVANMSMHRKLEAYERAGVVIVPFEGTVQ